MITHDAKPKTLKPVATAGGRHHVTVLFTDLSSSSRLAQAVEPETNIHILDTIIAQAANIISKHGGIVNQCHGDGVLAVFGFPKIQEDDVRRATEAALELHGSIGNLSFEALELPVWFSPRMHSGIDSGLVVIGDGDWIQGQYKVSGPAANAAAAFSSVAEAGEIIVSAPTLRGVLPFFATEERAPLALKDKGEGVAVYSVLHRSSVNTRFEARSHRGLTAFFGRAAELNSLDYSLREACQGHLQVVTIVGAAGLGKTRVVEEFLRRMQADCSVHRGYCESYGGAAPLQPFLQMLRQFFKLDHGMSAERSEQALITCLTTLDERLLTHKDAFLRMLSLHATTAASSRRASRSEPDRVSALTELFAALAMQRPLLLIIDDWQWADESSRQVLGSIIRAAQHAPVLIVTASRELDTRVPATAGAKVLQLAPFDEIESARKIRALLPDSLDSSITRIQQQSGGNALFIEELCESSPKDSVDSTTSVGGSIPKWLYGLIGTRVERLPEDQAQLVRAAAVIGNVVPSWLLERISGYGQADHIVHQLADNDVLSAGETRGMLRFKHGVTRDAVYELVGQPYKRQLHLRIARAIKEHYPPARRSEQYETLAYHYAGGADYPRAFYYAKCAGHKAMAASSLGSARQQYLAALDALLMLSQTAKMRQRWIVVSLRWALACVYGPSRDQLHILHRAVDYARELNDRNGLAHAHYWLGYLNYTLGEQTESIDHCRQALEIARELGNGKLTTQLLATLGQSLAAACDYPQALLHLDQAIEAKGRRISGSSLPVGSVYAMVCKGIVIGDSGNFGEAQQYIQWALDTVGGTDHEIEGSTLNMRGAVLLWQGRWEEAVVGAKRSQAVSERVYAPYLFGMARAMDGYASWMLAGAASGVETLKRATKWLEDRELRLFLSFPYGWLADVFAAAGEDLQAYDYGQRALAQARDHDRVGEAMACRALARVSARNQNANWLSPEEYLEMALQSAQARGSRHEEAVTHLHQAELYAALGQRAKALQLLQQARLAFAQMDMVWHDTRAAELARRI